MNSQQNRHFNVLYVLRQNKMPLKNDIYLNYHLPLNLTTTFTKMSWHFILHMLEH